MSSQPAFSSIYNLAFQVSPIILHNGIVSQASGGLLPIIGLTGQLSAFAQGVVTNGIGLEDFYATFLPLPGANVINNAIGTYPFANQQVAANAIIAQPLNISFIMHSPVRDKGGYLTKLAVFTALRNSLQAHCDAGGTFHVATPAYIYTDCILTAMTDITGGSTKQQQVQWQIDFVKPLVTQSDASAAFGSLISKLTAGSPLTSPTWSGPLTAAGSAIQGAAQGINNLSGAVNTFLSSTP